MRPAPERRGAAQEEAAAAERSLEAFSSDVELLRKLEHVVIPDAVALYTAGPLKVSSARSSRNRRNPQLSRGLWTLVPAVLPVPPPGAPGGPRQL